MEKKMRIIALIGCVILLSRGAPAFPEGNSQSGANETNARGAAAEAPSLDGDAEQVFTAHFVDSHSAMVEFHFLMDEKGPGSDLAMILMESLKRKLAEKGYERENEENSPSPPTYQYSVFIAGDVEYSKMERVLKRKEGQLTVLIMEKDRLAPVADLNAKENGMEYRQIEELADRIVKRIIFHLYI